MTSSNGNIFRITGPLWGESTGDLQRPVTRSFDVFLDLRLNKRLGKQSRSRIFGTPWRSNYDVTVMVPHKEAQMARGLTTCGARLPWHHHDWSQWSKHKASPKFTLVRLRAAHFVIFSNEMERQTRWLLCSLVSTACDRYTRWTQQSDQGDSLSFWSRKTTISRFYYRFKTNKWSEFDLDIVQRCFTNENSGTGL